MFATVSSNVALLPSATFAGPVSFSSTTGFSAASDACCSAASANSPLKSVVQRPAIARIQAPPTALPLGAQTPAQQSESSASSSAVFLVGDRHYVFVEETPGTYRRQAVGAGNAHDGWVNIRAGLSEGDKVVVEGNLHLLKFFKPGSEKPKAQ